jgi:hypothetical protein
MMTCSVKISRIESAGIPIQGFLVFGTAIECEPDPIKNSTTVKVSVTCELAKELILKLASVDEEGNWVALFTDMGRCICDTTVTVNAECGINSDCKAEPFTGLVECIECPTVTTFNPGDDVSTFFSGVCKDDGTAFVDMAYQVTNPLSFDIIAVLHCGAGAINPIGETTTIPANSTVEVITSCTYDVSVTTNAMPFVEFLNAGTNTPLGCDRIFF